MAKVEDFKYLGSTVQSNGECGREVRNRQDGTGGEECHERSATGEYQLE